MEDIPSKREAARRRAKIRRQARAELRQVSFEAFAAGWTAEQIAEMRKVSPRTIRREVAAAAAKRRLDGPGSHVQLQVARLTKALRVADEALDRGNLKAVMPLVRIVTTLDRYHGLGRADARAAAALSPAPPPLAPPVAALPLPLSHSYSVTYAESEKRTIFGA